MDSLAQPACILVYIECNPAPGGSPFKLSLGLHSNSWVLSVPLPSEPHVWWFVLGMPWVASPLVQVYQNVQGLVEKNFELTHHTTNHVPPNMKKPFTKLLKHLSLNSPHIVSMGRKSHHQIDDLHNKWGDMTQKIACGECETKENDSSESNRAEVDNITVELM